MATDYDAPRQADPDEPGDTMQKLTAARADAQSGSVDANDDAYVESLELPGADLSEISGTELTMPVVPKQDDEFTCASCFLVQHRSRLVRRGNGRAVCRDCA